MLKKLINEAIFKCELETNSPLLIKAGKGQDVLNPVDVDATYIKTYKDGILQPFIPGSSLKGVFRSYAESMVEESCDIVGSSNKNRFYTANQGKVKKECISQNTKIKDKNGEEKRKYINMSGEEKYNESCLICKLFGSDVLKSRIEFANAYPQAGYKIETVGMTAIDRVKGGARDKSLREIEYVDYGVFNGEIRVKNFAPYQIKLVTSCLQALDDGQLKVGGYTSKGFGELNIKSLSLILRYYNKKAEGYIDKEIYIEKSIEGLKNIEDYLEKVTYKDVNVNGEAL